MRDLAEAKLTFVGSATIGENRRAGSLGRLVLSNQHGFRQW